MPTFQSNPLNPSPWAQVVRKHPALFGVPFLLIIVGASFGMTSITQTRYDLQNQRATQVTKEEELGLNKRKKKFDIREEYYRLQAQKSDDWDQKRIERPKGVPDWGVPPTEPPPRTT
ncbi:hypothetical protein SCHPADRAFT_825619 [Schizopora paradoxa]|uniref:Cytochrome c oxidase assembly protein COX16, mitochondrial n=1 Tax=Schizopora paradoxa TaxID=27342 RepID=A0A0H2RZB3_9AGAM|nr:hypothetical protein SCHPADRAFT_825619 [Schizopora paradoxa]